MAFWDLIKKKESENNESSLGHLHTKLNQALPTSDDKQLISAACIAGLLARVAYVDFEIDPNEIVSMKNSLSKWTDYDDNTIETIANIAISEIKQLAGLENHIYAHQLNEILNENQKYQLLIALFALAAADGNADNLESEEIRTISTGLRLSHQHYISARATVADKLGALK